MHRKLWVIKPWRTIRQWFSKIISKKAPAFSISSHSSQKLQRLLYFSICPAQNTILRGLLTVSLLEENLSPRLLNERKMIIVRGDGKIIYSFTIQSPFAECQPWHWLCEYWGIRQGLLLLKSSQFPVTEVTEKTAKIPDMIILHEIWLWCYRKGWCERVGEGMLLYAQGKGEHLELCFHDPQFLHC